MPLVSSTRLVAGFIALLTCVSATHAQDYVDPIEFSYDYPRIGGEIGLVPTWQSGMYRTGCGEFVEGSRINPIIGVAYDFPIIDQLLRVEALAGYHSRGVASTYNSRETVILQTAGGTARVDVDFENEGELNTSYVFLMPSMKYYILDALYAGAGPLVSIGTGSSSQYRKTIISKVVQIPELGASEISYPEEESSDPYTKIFEPEDRPDVKGFGLDLVAYVGAEFKLGDRMKIGPRMSFTLPVTTVIDDPELKIFSFQLTIGLRYALFR
ncbi:MAG: hypothetical protein H7X80_08505 [bacterium]|nr:hypothetical protein [Candidatus Kapabacteria bacterium]